MTQNIGKQGDTAVRHEPAPADSEVLILSLLQDGPQYGYAISKRAAAASENQLRLTPGVLYPLLASMEKRGLIAAEWETVRSGRAEVSEEEAGVGGGGGRRRKWYSLSPKGAKHLEKRVAAHRAHVALIERFLSPRIGGVSGEEVGR